MSQEARQQGRVVSRQIAVKLRELAALIAQEEYGAEGRPPLATTFAEIEEIGHQAGQLLAGVIDRQLTAAHRDYFVAPQACPQCGGLCDPSPQERELVTRDGAITLSETVCHCPACRRDFFPSACEAPAGWADLQSQRADQDSGHCGCGHLVRCGGEGGSVVVK